MSAGYVYLFSSAQLYSWQIISDKHQIQTNSSFFTLSHPSFFLQLCLLRSTVLCRMLVCETDMFEVVSVLTVHVLIINMGRFIICGKHVIVTAFTVQNGPPQSGTSKWTHTKGAIDVNQPNRTRVIYYYNSPVSIYLFIRWLHSSANLFRSVHCGTQNVQSKLYACFDAIFAYFDIFRCIRIRVSIRKNRNGESKKSATTQKAIAPHNKKPTELNRVSRMEIQWMPCYVQWIQSIYILHLFDWYTGKTVPDLFFSFCVHMYWFACV